MHVFIDMSHIQLLRCRINSRVCICVIIDVCVYKVLVLIQLELEIKLWNKYQDVYSCIFVYLIDVELKFYDEA